MSKKFGLLKEYPLSHPPYHREGTTGGHPVKRCTRRELDRLEPSVPHQGVIALVNLTRYSDLPSILAKIQGNESEALLVMLDGVQDPRNLGAVLRTADAANADAVLIPKNRAGRYHTGCAQSLGWCV